MSRPPGIPKNTNDRTKLVEFACKCVRDLTDHFDSVGAAVNQFPRTPELLRQLVDYRYPDLVTEVKYVDTPSILAGNLVPGLTFPIPGGNLIHGRRQGKIVLTIREESPRMRLVYAQELFQRVLDIPTMPSPPLRDHVDVMIEYKRSPDWHNADPVAILEYLPEIAAMEFFFPYSHRCDHAPCNEGELEIIASRYDIPRNFAERHLSESYMSYFQPFHAGPTKDKK
jgi:hypothetical protein